MKKFYIFIVILLFVLPLTAQAQENYKSFDVTDSSDNNYTIQLKVQNDTFTDLNSNSYIGEYLKNYYIIGSVFKDGEYIQGKFKWDIPEYKISKGSQTVELIFTKFTDSENIVFQVYINGIEEPKRKIRTNDDKMSDAKLYLVDEGENVSQQLESINFYSPIRRRNDKKIDSIKGNFDIEDTNKLSVGKYKIKWIFTPDDSEFESSSGYINVQIMQNDKDSSSESNLISETTPTLTATSLLLDTGTTYDINVNEKPEIATYNWTSSDTKIATVNAKTGVVKSIKDGKSKITCKITTADETYTLTSNITVGIDEDLPVLDTNDLDLSIGDKYDLDIENQVAKSKYLYVSSNKTIATVNSANGIITAKGEGNAIIRCIVTTPSKQIIVLKCDINITK